MKKTKKKFAAGTPWYGQASNIAGNVGGAMQTVGAADEEVDGLDYAGNVLSSAGSMAAAGSVFGPIGTGVGALVGAGIGIFKSEQQKKEYEKALAAKNLKKKIAGINSNINNMNYSSMMVRDSSDATVNNRVAGFKRGTASYYAMTPGSSNAMISSGEGVKDQRSGRLDIVPGFPTNSDNVDATLYPGTSIYPNQIPVPGGKSTPAKLILKMKKVQDADEKMLNGKNSISPVDKRTAELNKKNIDIQSELLNMHTFINNIGGRTNTIAYKNGTTLSNIEDLSYNMASAAPIMYNLSNATPDYASPIYDSYYSQSIRSNVAKNIDDSKRQMQIARYNNRVLNSGSGMGSRFAASTYASGVNNTSNIYASADEKNNQYRMFDAENYNKVMAGNRAEDRRVQDLNSRSDAAARLMKTKAVEQISQLGQSKLLEKNQKQRDLDNLSIWSKYAMYVNPSVRADLLKELGITDGSQTSTISQSPEYYMGKLPTPKVGISTSSDFMSQLPTGGYGSFDYSKFPGLLAGKKSFKKRN